jgi:nitrite reductase/ring-hydroxylating ferredoxin subunit
MALVRVGAIADIRPGQVVRLDLNPSVAVYRVGDQFYATDDTCTHAQSSLSEGYLEGDVIECVFHSARFCVRTGKALSLPAIKPLKIYPVKIEGAEVFVEVG